MSEILPVSEYTEEQNPSPLTAAVNFLETTVPVKAFLDNKDV